MPDIEDRLREMLPPATVSFFVSFCRFEYALKRAGYLIRDEGRAEANWNAFARDLGANFLVEISATVGTAKLINEPPKRQIVVAGNLSWEPVEAVTNVQELFGAVSRIRNNLFHGGKFAEGVVTDSSRDQDLIAAAQQVLAHALAKNDRVSRFFREPLA
jgi:hypothetical protein